VAQLSPDPSTTIQISRLAQPEAMVEIELIAVVG
jgi:enamine deaminase RidA (YjgF/YER057c/UK114 family)